jgi:hypothetical protein
MSATEANLWTGDNTHSATPFDHTASTTSATSAPQTNGTSNPTLKEALVNSEVGDERDRN